MSPLTILSSTILRSGATDVNNLETLQDNPWDYPTGK